MSLAQQSPGFYSTLPSGNQIRNFDLSPNSFNTWEPPYKQTPANMQMWPVGTLMDAAPDRSALLTKTKWLPNMQNLNDDQEEFLSNWTMPTFFRNQMQATAWEDNMMDATAFTDQRTQQRQQGYYANFAFFPVIHQAPMTNYVYPWTALYCSGPIDPLIVSFGNRFPPTFTDVSYTLNGVGYTIHVHDSFITGPDAFLAIAASLAAGRALNGSFVYFFPATSDNTFHAAIENTSINFWSISGPSLGLATLMAILCGPPVLYTGFLSTIASHRVSPGNADGDNSGTPPLYEVAKQLNVIENVRGLPEKMAFAVSQGVPLVLPATNALRQPLNTVLQRVQQANPSAMLTFALSRQGFASSDVEAGKYYFRDPSVFLIATDANDAAQLGALGYGAFVFGPLFGSQGYPGGTTQMSLAQGAATAQVTAYNERRARAIDNTAQARQIAQSTNTPIRTVRAQQRAAATQARSAAKAAAARARATAKAASSVARAAFKRGTTRVQRKANAPKARAISFLTGGAGLRNPLVKQTRLTTREQDLLKQRRNEALAARTAARRAARGPAQPRGGRQAAAQQQQDAAPAPAAFPTAAGAGAAARPIPQQQQGPSPWQQGPAGQAPSRRNGNAAMRAFQNL